MNISSTPFIRNDYWPDYNELNELNGRINEVENELSLTNIFLNDRIENVENNLNTYIAGQNNTVTTNNIVVNNINANYAAGDYLNFNNINADNIYVENLIVNKPAFNVVLNTPHIENVTSLGGNIFNANIIDCEINTDNIFVNNLSVAQGTAETFKVTGDLIVNKNIMPISSSAVLGYDPTGKVIPVRATYDVSFPEDANYLFTDHFGTAYAGTAATEVGISSNLITAHAVKNAIDNVTANVNDSFNDINNRFDDVNNSITDGFNNVNDRLSNVDNTFNDVNNFVNDGFNDTNNLVNDLQNIINDQQNIIDNLRYQGAAQYSCQSPLDYRNIVAILYDTPANRQGVLISTPATPFNSQVFMSFNSATNILTYSSDTEIYPESVMKNRIFNNNASNLFGDNGGCANFNINVNLGRSVTNMYHTFFGCSSLDQNIQIPDNVKDMTGTFYHCYNLNQNIQIPDSVTDMSYAFYNCTSLDQAILIPDSVTAMDSTFRNDTNLNQNIHIGNNVTSMRVTFDNCRNLNQNILIPNSVTDMSRAFHNCTSLDQAILIPDSVTDMEHTFQNCYNLNQNIHIGNNVTDMSYAFHNCRNLNQNILIPDSVTNMAYTFYLCAEVPQTYVPDTFTNAYDYVNDSLYNAVNTTFNQNIKLSSSLTNMTHMLHSTAFNQNIVIPDGVTDMSGAFSTPYLQQILRYSSNNAIVRVDGAIARARLYIGQFNQNITIPNSVTNLEGTFQEQVCFNQNILIPNSVVDMSRALTNCVEFNQNILIPNSVTNMSAMLLGPDLSEVCKMIKDNIVSDVHSMAFNQPDMYIYSQNVTDMDNAFNGCHINNIHIPTSVPKDTSNYMYNCLVNGNTGITFPAANIFNDLPVDIEQWPPL